jgi:hypothetical protein
MQSQKWWVKAMSAAKWIRFAVLICFTFLFFYLHNVRGDWYWLFLAVIFGALSALTLKYRK